MTDEVDIDVERAVAALVLKWGIDASMSGCCSFVSRSLGCGYNRAARILEEMESRGIITAADAVGARRFLKVPT